MSNRLSLWPGKPLWAGYRLKHVRGEGGFGQVWEAEGPDGDRVALKFLRCGSSRAAAQEVRNIQTVREVPHPLLVRIHQVWADRGYLVIVMELADGSLDDMLTLCRQEFQSALPAGEVGELLGQAAEALDFLNARRHPVGGVRAGIQHCDVKPSNLLVCGDQVKVCDFGLATATTGPVTPHPRAGTPGYAAPEVFQGQLTPWTDQYALAVTYCELRAGRRPLPDPPGRFETAYTPPDPDLSFLPAAERPAVARALARRPADRWPTCAEFMARVGRAAG